MATGAVVSGGLAERCGEGSGVVAGGAAWVATGAVGCCGGGGRWLGVEVAGVLRWRTWSGAAGGGRRAAGGGRRAAVGGDGRGDRGWVVRTRIGNLMPAMEECS
ncbi:hypothetical protein GCM10027269_56730 [Kribbella endophytica]